MKVIQGSGLLNCLINHLPFELHLPGYHYCGPGTNLIKRLQRGDKGINLLDEYCKDHDIAYYNSLNLEDRHKADIKLFNMSRKRATASNASPGEKLAARLVNKAMLAKISHGAGMNIKSKTPRRSVGLKSHFKNIVRHTKNRLMKLKPKCKDMAIDLAVAAAKELTKNSPVKIPRIIPIPKTGGFLPLIPIFAGLSAAGSLVGGAAAISKLINEIGEGKKRLAEMKRHNEKMEVICSGNGLKLRSYKKGLGISLPDKKN